MSVALAWVTIIRFGLVQASIAAITVLPIATLPRLMIEEQGFLAMASGVLIGVHYAVQVSRLRFGYGSDVGRWRTPWIVGGLIGLALAGIAASASVALMAENPSLGYAAALLSYAGVGIGVGAAGTTLLALLAVTVAAERRAPAATIVWLLMIASLAITATQAGKALDPFSYARLIEVSALISLAAVALGCVAVFGIESRASTTQAPETPTGPKTRAGLVAAFREVWAEPAARQFTAFVFLSMFAYNIQELVLEPFSAAIYGLSPGESTQLSGRHHMGVFFGLIAIAVIGRVLRGSPQALVAVTVGGCLLSALGLVGIGVSAFFAPAWPLFLNVLAFGFANGLFAGAAIASMFSLAGVGRERREGTRMGIWGAAQAIGFGLGMFAGAVLLDILRSAVAEPSAFASVFWVEAAMFAAAAVLALRLTQAPALPRPSVQPA